jgi:hypothetical protein
MHRFLALLMAAAMTLSFSETALALPKFALRTGVKCQSCHVNPAGGSMRQTFGMQYGRDRLPLEGTSEDMQLEDFTNLISNVLGVGADFRTLYYYVQDTSTASSNRNSFVQMQGDLYLNFRVSRKVNLFLKKGIYGPFEVFGLFNVLPAKGHVKVGKFVPNFGTRIDDHTAYIRSRTGFDPVQAPELTGLEAGIAPGPLSISGGVYNSVDGGSINAKALLGRAEGLFAVTKDLYASIGGSVFTKKIDLTTTQNLYGGFGGVGFGPLALFGEMDWINKKSDASDITGLISYVEADYMVVQGVDLKLAYDFYDQNLDVKDGAQSRYSFGVEFFPLAGVELRVLYRIVTEEPTSIDNNQLDVMLHLYL